MKLWNFIRYFLVSPESTKIANFWVLFTVFGLQIV